MALKEREYLSNFVTLKKYGNQYKLTYHKSIKNKGVEVDDKEKTERCCANSKKLDNNLSRTKSTIFELAICNDWDWFFTFTIDKTKYDRYNLNAFKKDLSQWIRNYKRLKGVDIKYLIIPEQHKDGAWHFHGFLKGLPIEHLTAFKSTDKLSTHILKKIKAGGVIYNWLPYAKKFGFCDIEPIKNHEACSKYITKYITKDLERSVTELNSNMYYCSLGLKRAEVIRKCCVNELPVEPPSFSNDYLKIWWSLSESEFNCILDDIQV